MRCTGHRASGETDGLATGASHTVHENRSSLYPCATHGPDVVCAVTAAADRTTHLAFTRGKRDVGHGKPYHTGAFRFGGKYGEAAAAAGIKSLTIYLTLCPIALGTFPIVRYNK